MSRALLVLYSMYDIIDAKIEDLMFYQKHFDFTEFLFGKDSSYAVVFHTFINIQTFLYLIPILNLLI